MNQEEKETFDNEDATNNLSEAVSPDEQEIENLPIESIGSYARIEELLTDEEKENTSNPTARS